MHNLPLKSLTNANDTSMLTKETSLRITFPRKSKGIRDMLWIVNKDPKTNINQSYSNLDMESCIFNQLAFQLILSGLLQATKCHKRLQI